MKASETELNTMQLMKGYQGTINLIKKFLWQWFQFFDGWFLDGSFALNFHERDDGATLFTLRDVYIIGKKWAV